ncbi:hypothetical protein C9925_00020 [cyanobacterium G8-9]|nr:hypothetical protein C9925_00020 [cyanobacterium G8-9]
MKLEQYSEKKTNIQYDKNMKIVQVANDTREEEWLKENKEAIDKQNERMKREGSFSDEHRRF